MDLGLTSSELKFRDDFRAWLKVNMPKKSSHSVRTSESAAAYHQYLKDWQRKLFDGGYAGIAWPKEFGGRGATFIEQAIFQEELALADAPELGGTIGLGLVGPTIIAVGTEAQKQRYLPGMLSGDEIWCQGFSEPNAGSDLASLETKALPDGDHFVVNGQKIWTSYADQADWIFCLVRTDPAAPKHEGISFILFDMESAGVSTKPITLISGKSPFCQTFFDDVLVPKENLVGELNKGWGIAKYLLTHERDMIGGMGGTSEGRSLGQIARETIGTDHAGTDHAILADTVLRGQIASFEIDAAAFRLTMERVGDMAKAGQAHPAVSSMLKYYGTELNKRRLELQMAAGGSDALEWEGDRSRDGYAARAWLRSKANSIEGGTSEVQLNIIAKRILGLPGA